MRTRNMTSVFAAAFLAAVALNSLEVWHCLLASSVGHAHCLQASSATQVSMCPAPRIVHVSLAAEPRDPVDQMAAALEPTRVVVYKKVGDRELHLHIFEPEGHKPGDRRPCFVTIHGGGWTGGEPRRMYPFAAYFARLGMVGISVEYRLLKSRPEVTVFDCVKDGRSAVRYVRAHAAEFGVDPNRIAVSGGSAGGHVAAATALFDGVDEAGDDASVSSVPNALVLYFPVIDTSKEGYGNAKIGERWQELSPLHHVRPGVPPTIIFHGTGDTTTPFAGAKGFYDAMLQAGNRCELVVNEGGIHGYLMRDRALFDDTMRKTEEFLAELTLVPSNGDAATPVAGAKRAGTESGLMRPVESVPPAPCAKPGDVDGKSYDLVVVGGTPGGIACAVRAAREGLTVLLVHHTGHLGGFITSGAGGWEAPYDGLRSPLYAEMRNGAAEYYRKTYGDGSQQHLAAMPKAGSNRHIDRAKVEPRIAELLLNRMVAGEPRLTLLLDCRVTGAQRDGAILKSVILRETRSDRTCRVGAKVFADAMYEGDLVAAAKAPYRVGREARSEYHEPHAGVVYTRASPKPPGQSGFPKDAAEGRLNIRCNPHADDKVILPESTGEADRAVMAYNYRLILTRDPANRVMVPRPANADPEAFRGGLSRSIVPNLPNGKIAWNGGGRLIGPQNEYPEGDWPTRDRISRQYLDAALEALWLVQNAPGVPAEEREFWKDYGLAKDEFPDNGHVPYEVYVREARRIVGRYVFTEHDGVAAAGIGRTPVHPDSVAITDWPLDSVACLPRKVRGGKSDGIFFLAEQSRPAQVPYRCFLPQGIDNLLVPVCLSATHAGWGCIRLEPVWVQTGEAAGFAAALAVKRSTTPARLDPEVLLRTLVTNRVMVSFFNDVDVASGESWTAAVQYFGTKGFFHDYDARMSEPLKEATGKAWAEGFAKLLKGKLDANALALAVAKAERTSARMTRSAFATLLPSSPSLRQSEPQTIMRQEAIELIFSLLP